MNFFLLANQSFCGEGVSAGVTGWGQRCHPPGPLTRLIRALMRSKSMRGIILREIWFWLGST